MVSCVSRASTGSEAAAIFALLVAAPAWAEVDLRIEAWPRSAPIEAFVLVTKDAGPARDLTVEEFAITLDGQVVNHFELRLPAALDPARNLSIVFVQADGRAMQQATPTILQMDIGDFAAVVRAWYMPGDPTPLMRVLPFTPTDGESGTAALVGFLMPGLHDQAQLRYGSMVPHEQWLAAGLDQLESPGVVLPEGPRAIVMQGNGRSVDPLGYPTQSDLVARANELGMPVFTLVTVDLSPSPVAASFMAGVAAATGGRYLSGADYETIHSLLNDAYQVVIPASAVSDCNPHMFGVTVRGETASMPFERCDRTPDALVFEEQANVAAGSVVVSNTVSIVGIDTPVEVSVIGGEYALGCGRSFTTVPGIAMPGDLVCVRHTASRESGALNETTLIAGGVGSTFYSSTAVTPTSPPPPPLPPPPGGGGGAAGLWELLAALSVLRRLRQRQAQT